MASIRWVVLVAAVALFGCGGTGRFVGRGMEAYKYGDYANAAEHFDYIEKEGLQLNAQGEVRFFVYKGLTLVHLGKKDEGLKFLLKGRELYRAGNPKWLAAEIVTEMDETIAQLGAK